MNKSNEQIARIAELETDKSRLEAKVRTLDELKDLQHDNDDLKNRLVKLQSQQNDDLLRAEDELEGLKQKNRDLILESERVLDWVKELEDRCRALDKESQDW